MNKVEILENFARVRGCLNDPTGQAIEAFDKLKNLFMSGEIKAVEDREKEFTSVEACEYLKVSMATLYRLGRDGRITCRQTMKRGTKHYSLTDLQNFLKTR